MRRFILSAVTDSSLLPPKITLLKRIELLCKTGVRRIVLREKGMPVPEYRAMAREFVSICRRYCTIPVISHHADIAMEYGTELQLSMDELRKDPGIVRKVRYVGASVHSVDEAKEAESLGASSVTAGHIFKTDCKKGVPERGLPFLKDVVDSVGIPVYAIGGIDLDVIDDIYSTGASGACLMSTMMNSSEEHIDSLVRRCFDINRPVFRKECLALYAVTDRRWLKEGESLASAVEKAILGGVTMVQIREKDLDRGSFISEAEQCLRVCRSYGIPMMINDDVSVATEIGADGVHLGQDDVSPAEASESFKGIIGVSAHNADEAISAYEDGADYIGCGAVFSTSTKSDTKALGVDGLRSVAKITRLPMVAIGGINSENAIQLKGSGISGIAVVSAIFSAEDVTEAARELRSISNSIISDD